MIDRFYRSFQQALFRAIQTFQRWAARPAGEGKVIVVCPNCSQKLRIPRRRNKLIVTCTVCRHEFSYRYYALGFSSSSKKPLLVGLVGSLVGFTLVELLQASQALSAANLLVRSALFLGIFGACFGAVLGAAEGFLRKDKERMSYGFQVGFLLGLVSGVVAGLVAQLAFSAVLSFTPPGQPTPWGLTILARVIGWAVLGLLIGGSYGIKENTHGDLKYGLIGGALGGAVAGLVFDPLSSLVNVGSGALGRLIGFLILGMAIGVAVKHFQEIGIRQGSKDMFRPLSPRLPANTRMLPQPGRRRA